MEAAAAEMFGAGVGLGMLAAVGVTCTIWLVWLALRQWGPRRGRAPASRFPAVSTAILVMFFTVPTGCVWVFIQPAEPQPESARTVAAFEVPLSTASDREEFLALLSEEAKVEGFHVDAASAEEVKYVSDLTPMTINAAVWRGENDDEVVASVTDGSGPLGLPILGFSKGAQPARTARFRESVMRRIMLRWPKTLALPIMPTGAIPLHEDLLLTKDGYRVKTQAAPGYELPSSSPLLAEH